MLAPLAASYDQGRCNEFDPIRVGSGVLPHACRQLRIRFEHPGIDHGENAVRSFSRSIEDSAQDSAIGLEHMPREYDWIAVAEIKFLLDRPHCRIDPGCVMCGERTRGLKPTHHFGAPANLRVI